MRHQKIIIAGIAVAAVAAGGVTAASAGSSPASSVHSAGPGAAAATVRTAPAAVAGKTETILVNARGLPLYFYRPDTAAKSFVTGGLARLWPPLTSAAAPAAAGVSGKLTVRNDANGRQVAYNGHLLYTFASDQAGQVTGQGPELLRGHPRHRPDSRLASRHRSGRPGRRRSRLLSGRALIIRTEPAPPAAPAPAGRQATSRSGIDTERGWSR